MTTPIMQLDCDGLADALADYLEGDAPEPLRAAVDAHASFCAACGQLLADLRVVRADAAALPTLTPSRDLWAGIAERIDARVLPLDAPRAAHTSVARRNWRRPALAAAALVVVTAGITNVLTRASIHSAAPVLVTGAAQAVPATPLSSSAPAQDDAAADRAPGTSRAPTPSRVVGRAARSTAPTGMRLASTAPAPFGEPVFTTEIAKLRRIVRGRRDQLDPATVAVLEQSIAVIDSAIAQSRAALAKDPASGFLATQLNHSLGKKVELLRTAASLPART